MTMFRFNRFRFPDEGPSRKRRGRQHGDEPTYTPVETPTRADVWKSYGAWLLLAVAAATPATILIVGALLGSHSIKDAFLYVVIFFGAPTLMGLAAAGVPIYRAWQERRFARISDLDGPEAR